MTRSFAPAVSLLLSGSLAFAQLPPVPLTVDPAAEPRPAFRYELLVPARDRVSGNAAHHYTKAALARPAARQPDDDKKLAAWDEVEAGKLPLDDVKAYLKGYAAALRELEHGTRCKTCEWASAPASGPDALADELAATQHFRELARALALRVRVELAENRFDAAAATLRTGLQFAKHYGEGPSLIRLLVGHAMAGLFLARAEEFVARASSPNLYWALTALPRPLIDPRPSLDGEDGLNESFLPGLADLRKGAVAAEKALDVAEASLKLLAAAENTNPLVAVGGRLAIGGQAAVHHTEAKKALLARGWEKPTVEAMPAVQAVFLNSFEAYRELADDHRKWFLAPLPESFDGLAKAVVRVKTAQKEQKGDAMFQTFLLVLPAVEKVHQAGARTERKLAALRVVEAVRIHAEAAATLPAALADARKVPVPADPLTGTPFVYRSTAAGFTLTSPESESVPKALAITYEVTLRK